MAIYIPIFKESEDDQTVVYCYARQIWEADPDSKGRQRRAGEQIGKVGLNKQTGDIVRLVDIPDEFLDFYLPRVKRKVRQAFEKREYADRIDYMA